MILNSRKPDGTPMSTAAPAGDRAYSLPSSSASSYDRGADTPHSIVDKHLTMKGDLESEGDILIKGKVLGNIRCKLLIIDVDAMVDGGIDAEEVVIRGKAKGTIVANRVKLEKSAVVDSEIEHNSFSAEEGARVKGALRFREEPLSRSVKDGLSLAA